jgi:choline kinase
VKAIILAAGMGSRLGRSHPKALTILGSGTTIMGHQLGALEEFIHRDRVIVVVGFRKELVMEAFPELLFVYNRDFKTTNTSRSLLHALRKVHDEDVLWINGDVVLEPEVVQRLFACRYSAMAVNTARVGAEEVKYRLDRRGYINQVSKTVRGGLGEAVGVNLVRRRDVPLLRSALARCDHQDYFERGIELAIVDGMKVRPVDVSDLDCLEVDFQADLRVARRTFKRMTAATEG